MIYHVETKTDFLFFIADNKQQIIDYLHNKRIKINKITETPKELYNNLLEVEFIEEAVRLNG